MQSTNMRKRLGTVMPAAIFCLFTLTLGHVARAADYNPARSTSALLVDLARDHGLNCAGRQTPEDLVEIKTLLRAAVRLDPRNVRALVWLYELASRGDDPRHAAELLGMLVQADPDADSAFAAWLETGPPDVQSLEQRQKWLTELLDEYQDPRQRALIHTHLAVAAWQQADRTLAQTHLENARRLWPDCPEAALAALEPASDEDSIDRRLTVMLRALALKPLDVELTWQTALLLHANGFPDEALPFFQHALSVHQKVAPEESLASSRLLDLAANALARGDRAAAEQYAASAASAESGVYEARFMLLWLFKDRQDNPRMKQLNHEMADRFAEIKAPAEWPPQLVSEAAWYYCIIDIQAQRALMLAENAAERLPNDAFATRVHGWALALNGRDDEARAVLEPVAKLDAYAAYQTAAMTLKSGDREAAARIVDELAFTPQAGRARELLDSLDLPSQTAQAASDKYPRVPAVLDQFNYDVLEFHKDVKRFLRAEIKLADSSFMPGDPWRVIFSLTNTGSFPITLGPDWMVNPVLLLSFHCEGDRTRDYPNLLTVSVDRKRVIEPGKTVHAIRTVDVGPLRKIARRSPQQLQSVIVSAVLDPRSTPDGWRPGPAGFELSPASFVRLPANSDPEAVDYRFSILKNDSKLKRFHAVEEIAQLLGEAQLAAAGKLNYKPTAIPVGRAYHALAQVLEDDSWEIRVRALEALQCAGLDSTLFAAARKCLDHPHWCVRLAAVRLLARQGAAFNPTAERLAEYDPDELVREIARCSMRK